MLLLPNLRPLFSEVFLGALELEAFAVEAFGAGRKVLFGASYNQKLLEQWGVVQYYQNLPRLICLQDDSLARFSDQVDMLLHMDENIYKECTQIAASYYLAMPDSNYPHEVIRQRIANHLANS